MTGSRLNCNSGYAGPAFIVKEVKSRTVELNNNLLSYRNPLPDISLAQKAVFA